MATLWPSRKTLKNEVKLEDPEEQDEEDGNDVNWLAITIKKDDEEDLRMPKKDVQSKKVYNIDDEPVGIHKKGFG